MDARRLKTTISRKPLNRLSVRQKRRIRNEIQRNMVAAQSNIERTDKVDDKQNPPNTSNTSEGEHGLESEIIKRLQSSFVEKYTPTLNNKIDTIMNDLQEIKAQIQSLHEIVQSIRTNGAGSSIDCKTVIAKPSWIPFTNVEALIRFDTAEEHTFDELVAYLQQVGGFSAKEAVNIAIKEVLDDGISPLLTWYGKERSKTALADRRLMFAIYKAACTNPNFQKPSRREFQEIARQALRSCKERFRKKNLQNDTCELHFWDRNEEDEPLF